MSAATAAATAKASSNIPYQKLGEGAYGCIIYPELPTDKNFQSIPNIDIDYYNKSPLGIVSKIFLDKSEADEEFQIASKLNGLDATQTYFVYPIYKSSVVIDDKLRNKLNCKLFNTLFRDYSQKQYALVGIPYGGETLEKLLGETKMGLRIFLFVLLNNVINGIERLHKNGYAHTDIKIDNIVLRRNKNIQGLYVSRLIDFGKLTDISSMNQADTILNLMNQIKMRKTEKEELVMEAPEFRILRQIHHYIVRPNTPDKKLLVTAVAVEEVKLLNKANSFPANTDLFSELFGKSYGDIYSVSLDKFINKNQYMSSVTAIDMYQLGLVFLYYYRKNVTDIRTNVRQDIDALFQQLIIGCLNPNPLDRLNITSVKTKVSNIINAFKSPTASTTAFGTGAAGAAALKKTDETVLVGNRPYKIYKGGRGKKYVRSKGAYIGLTEFRKKHPA